MKGYLKFLAGLSAVMLLVLLVLAAWVRRGGTAEQDTLLYNDIVQTAREHPGDPAALAAFDTAFLYFGTEGKLQYASAAAPADAETLNEAIRQGYTCLAVHEGSTFLGTAAFPDPDAALLRTAQQRLLLTALLVCGSIWLIAAAFGLFLYLRIIRPFRGLRKFAGQIAQGNLDEPLLMDRQNLFGAFSESFDIMREALRESRRHEKELVASLSHDIRTPVTGIKLLCELLCVKTEDAYVRDKVGQINQKAEQINLLANDLLHSSLDDLGELTVHCQDEASGILQELIAEHDTKGFCRGDAAPECLLSVDRSRLSQVVANIISNSYKYAGTPIDVRFAFAGDFLTVTFADQGGGVPEEELEQITQKYYRGRENAAGKEGSGLGLYISRILMEKMQGELSCSCPEGGFAVTLSLPLS
ncbi:MAG: HAMP domain-containing histidine kinase [Oscillospiraceae bacterium]|nr:HAMP domain-containing histidine kinase [Oscillospiraceae bacterium]